MKSTRLAQHPKSRARVAGRAKLPRPLLRSPKNITLPQNLRVDGEARAAEEGRTFSNYVAWLIARDCKGAKTGGRA